MPIFLTVLLSAIAQLYTAFKASGLFRYAIFATAVTLAVGAFGVVRVGIDLLLTGIIPSVPSIVPITLSWVVPSNFDELIAAKIAAEVIFAIYRWQHNIILQAASLP